MSSVPTPLARWGAFDELARALATGDVCVEASGLWGSARALTVAGLARSVRRPVLVVAAGPAQAHALGLDIGFFLGTLGGAPAPRVLEFPPGTAWRGGRRSEHDAERALVCYRLLAGEPVAVVT